MDDFKLLVLQRVSEANLHAFLHSQGCPPGLIEDVIQETFISVLRTSVSNMCIPPTSSIRTCAKCRWIDYYRASSAHQSETLPDLLPDKSIPTLEAMCTAERCAVVRKAIELLPSKYRVTLELVEVEGKSYSAVAEQLAEGIEAVRSRLQRTRNKLKKIYFTFIHEEE
ncbi:MAG: RNA polymerase sigma factor [Gemmatales bacterium]